MQGDVRKDLSVCAVYSCPHSWCWRAHCSHVSCLIARSYCCVLNSCFSWHKSTFFVGETLIFCYLLLLALNRVVVSTQNKQMVAFGWDMGDFICFFITSCFALACLSLSNVEALRSSGMLRSSTWLKWRLASRWSTSFRCVEVGKTLKKTAKRLNQVLRPGRTLLTGVEATRLVSFCMKNYIFLAVWPITACGDLWVGILTLECWLCVFFHETPLLSNKGFDFQICSRQQNLQPCFPSYIWIQHVNLVATSSLLHRRCVKKGDTYGYVYNI